MKTTACAKSGVQSWDCGPEPLVVNLSHQARCNTDYRRALWTGDCLQVTVMCIPVCGDVGQEMHEDVDQLIVVEDGCALVEMGREKDKPQCRRRVTRGCAVMVPACTWHNIINVGRTPLKLYTVYGPPHHPSGVVQRTKQEAHT